MSLADKQMYLKELELVLGDFIPANDMQKVLVSVEGEEGGYRDGKR